MAVKKQDAVKTEEQPDVDTHIQPGDSSDDLTPETEDVSNDNPLDYKGWIKMTEDEMLAAQENEVLIGWHPTKGLGLVKAKETKKK